MGTMASEVVCKYFVLGLEAYKGFGFAFEACNYFGFVVEACKSSDLAIEGHFGSEVCKNFGSAVEAGRYFDLVAGVHNCCFGFEACRYSDFEGGGVVCNCWCSDFVVVDTKCQLPLGSCMEAWGFLHLGSYYFGNLVR